MSLHIEKTMRNSAANLIAIVGAALLALPAAPVPAFAAGSVTLAQVEARGVLRCGVSDGIAGFSQRDASGQWSGIDVDFCRAVAAATLGDANKVAFVPLRASARFPALRTGRIDLLARNTTWTLLREGTLGIQFAGVLLYDAQAFMVSTASGIRTLASLKGVTVCVQRETTSEDNLVGYSNANALDLKPVVLGSAAELEQAFTSGRCRAVTADLSLLATLRSRTPGGASALAILSERISKQPHAPAVRGGDDAWLVIVRWVLFTLIAAEELGVTRQNQAERVRDPLVARALVPDPSVTATLGIGPGWTLRALKSAGNYGEMFNRNLGTGSPIKLDRGLNELYTRGGLMYAPPMQ
ncbi:MULTISPECIES: amino acid ABC transporter substrate-binding protein [Caballeronia]|jgi:general L-amino acid transport system substrate-binding protein|uniref:Amino acid ABC transporter substrate-binding protein n=1 Tax=Caballeronia jiangsuensis TaxID=1458357 RepID=A0ABW9CT25_9BURK|nr:MULTISPECIES: amino acid ABC transporter substrate-binding protein [Caballeronia]GJH08229.1 amino acid ABC transporter substrate-binding protein [Caballeronia novacaledonica]